jgi:hypothetical protein
MVNLKPRKWLKKTGSFAVSLTRNFIEGRFRLSGREGALLKFGQEHLSTTASIGSSTLQATRVFAAHQVVTQCAAAGWLGAFARWKS